MQKPIPQDERDQLIAMFREERYAELESRTRLLVERYSDSGFAWKALGVALKLQGKDGLYALKRATELLPNDADAHYNVGVTLQSLERFDAAVASYRRAVELKPDYAEAHNNLGNTLKALGMTDSAVECYNRALEIRPNYAQGHSNMGNVLKDCGQLDAALASYRRALDIKPDLTEAHINLGFCLLMIGQHKEALTCFQNASTLGSKAAKVLAAMLLPPIIGTRQAMLESRAQFERNVDKLIQYPVLLDDPFKEVGNTNFYLAYHGLNDRELQVKIAKFYEKACPSLLYSSPHCAIPRHSGNIKIRVGFLSKYIYDHSISRCFGRIIEALSQRDLFEVVLISSHNIDDTDCKNGYSGFSGECVQLSGNLTNSRERVASLQLDVLVYLDIGMEALSYFMAFSRLARVQCVLGGHPVTTGIGNMDYFLSTNSGEIAGADAHYSEELVRFHSAIFYFERPTLPARFKTRSELGMPEAANIYMCPMRLQKLHPDFDLAIARILQLDSKGVVLLFEDYKCPLWKALLMERFRTTIPIEFIGRIMFLPWIFDYADFISANVAADVVLDPFHFGIGSTIIATFAVGTPIVTKPGEFLRGRAGLVYCNMLGLLECIAEDTEEYARKAVEIASDQRLRETIKTKILANNHVLYENHQPVEELARFLHDVMQTPT